MNSFPHVFDSLASRFEVLLVQQAEFQSGGPWLRILTLLATLVSEDSLRFLILRAAPRRTVASRRIVFVVSG